jgi:acyl-CoA synthetase (AMP-forming)/AMP-acid ligase II
MLSEFHGYQEAMVMVHWLPLFHDMGLIRGMLSPVHMGGSCLMLDPMDFVARPLRWLEALSRFRATVTGAPDFGFALAARKVRPEQLEALDFSSLRLAFCSAEPIKAVTLRRFEALLAPYGLGPGVLKPAYGLAEATVMVTGETRDRYHVKLVGRQALAAGSVEPPAEPGDSVEVVCCGRPLGDQELQVVEEGVCLPVGRVGEVWLRGPSVSASAADGFLRSGEGPYLRTGDLGWLDEDGYLMVCGRRKDLLIVRGQNYLAHDLEAALEERVPQLRPGCSAAFEVEGGVAVACEVAQDGRHQLSEVARAVWAAAGEELGLSLREVVLLSPGGIPKTSSGKVQRSLARSLHLSGGLPSLHHWQAPARPD